jgi:hypothetical protein
LVLTLTAIGASASFDTAPDGAPAQALLGAARALSARLGGGAPK